MKLAGLRLADRFELSEEIGRGGFSIVHAAHDSKIDRPVAVKILVPPPATAELALERLRREVQAARSVDHPNVVTVHDLIEEDGRAFLIMDRVDGPDLRRRVEEQGPLDGAKLRAIGAQIADALSTAHARGIVHRDIKPANILLASNGERAMLSDFGSARIDGSTTLTATGGIVGTLDYAAPEVLRGERADARADIYALGLSLLFGATGKLPKSTDRHLPPEPTPEGFSAKELGADLEPELERIIRRATARRPEDRFLTAHSLKLALDGEPSALARFERPGFCLACGEDGVLEAVCRACARRSTRDVVAVFIRPGESPSPVEHKLRTVLSAASGSLDEVLAGRRALVHAHPNQLDRLMARLADLDAGPTSLPLGQAYRRVPHSLLAVSASMAVSGLALGVVTGSIFGWLGFPASLLLFAGGTAQVTRPIVQPTPRPSQMPDQVQDELAEALAQIERPEPRRLLANLADLAEVLVEGEASPDTKTEVFALVAAATGVARALASTEDVAEQLGNESPDLRELAESKRAVLEHRILEGIDALGRLSLTQRSDDGELHELTESLKIREEAFRELDDYLSRHA